MRFYNQPHRFYCGVDLHTRTLSLCVLDAAGAIVLEATLPPEPDRLLAALAPYRDGLVVGVECVVARHCPGSPISARPKARIERKGLPRRAARTDPRYRRPAA